MSYKCMHCNRKPHMQMPWCIICAQTLLIGSPVVGRRQSDDSFLGGIGWEEISLAT